MSPELRKSIDSGALFGPGRLWPGRVGPGPGPNGAQARARLVESERQRAETERRQAELETELEREKERYDQLRLQVDELVFLQVL